MKKFLLSLFLLTAFVLSAGTTVFTVPQTRTMNGKVDNRYIRWRSKEFAAKPNTWYRASAEIRTMMEPSAGALRFRVRNIKKDGKSIVYATIAALKPGKLDFTNYSDVFMTKPNCERLQIYIILDRINGQAQIRNIKIEELSAEGAEKIVASKLVESAFFSPPVCAFTGERSFFWGYRVSAAFVKKGMIPAQITLEIPALKIKAAHKVKVNEHNKVWCRTPRLKAGNYEVIMKALDANGKTLHENRSNLKVIKRPAYGSRYPAKTISISPDGTVIVNGKPTLLKGIYHAHNARNAKNVAGIGFNAAQTWASKPASYKKILDVMAANKIYANCVLKNISGKKLDDLIAVIKDHPAIFSWDIVDEPAIRNITPEKIMPCVNQLRAYNTARPLRISFSDFTVLKKYQKCFDMPAVHKYVLPYDGLAAQGKIVREVVKSVAPGQSPQITLQSWVHWSDETQRPQTAAQTRSLAYISLINGAKGLWWYHFPTAYRIPHIWGAMKQINAELFELEEVILGKRTVLKSAPAAVEAAAFTNGKRTVIIAVNTSKNAAETVISGIKGEKLTELYANGEVITAENGKIKITIPAETTRIFE